MKRMRVANAEMFRIATSYSCHLKPQPGIPMVIRTYNTTWTKKMKKNIKKLKELSLLLRYREIHPLS